MKNVKYIPGDLVRSNNNPKIIWKVKDVSQDKKGNVLYRLIAVEEEEAFVYLYESQIAPIPLTAAILEANGWKRDGGQYSFSFSSYTGDKVGLIGFFIEMFKDVHDMLKHKYYQIAHEDKVICGCFYCHQLQHLLFGLGLDSSLKV